jgi:hypothetical protein
MDLSAIKAKYGDRLLLADIVHGLPGKKKMVDVKTRLEQLAPGGGLSLLPTTSR